MPHVYDSAPQYRVEERQERDEPGPAIAWHDNAEYAATAMAKTEAKLVGHRGAHGIWYAVVNKDTGEVMDAYQS